MLKYVALGTNDIDRAAKFYNELFVPLKATQVMDSDGARAWSTGEGPMLLLLAPGDGKPATVGNGSMVSLVAPSSELVDEIYNKALELGGKDEGAPRDSEINGKTLRVAYFRDLDGHKLDVVYQEA